MFDTALEETFSEQQRQNYRDVWTRSGLRSMINYYRAAMRYQELPKAGGIEVPTLIIWGRRDHVLREEMAGESIEPCRNGRLVIIDEATHWVHLDSPERFNAEMERISIHARKWGGLASALKAPVVYTTIAGC